MAKAVRLSDIAARFGVSTVTASKALSGQSGVSEELRKKIEEAAREMGYVSPAERRQQKEQKGQRTYNIGALIASRYLEKYNSFYMQMHHLIATEAVSRGCFAMMEEVTFESEKALTPPKVVKEGRADGLLVIGQLSEDYLDMLHATTGVPVVYLDFMDRHASSDAVISDSFYGAYVLTNYLFETGHRSIAYVGTVLATGSITDRYLGYLKSMMEHRVEPKPEWRIDDRDPVTGQMDAERFFALPDPLPEAFVCNCDLTASVLIRKLKERGVEVPGDVSVVGYDRFLYPGLCDMHLTTYEVDMKEMAKRAIKTLLHKMKGEPYKQGTSIIAGSLLVRDSVRSR